MIPPENDAEITYLLEGINFDDIEFEDIGVRAEGDGDAVMGGSEGEGDVVRGGAEGDDETVRVGVESEGDAVRVGAESEGGVEESEFDDSSDSDYVQPIESDDSDAPSLVFEDIEDSSDEDIFLQKHPSKKHLMRKLKKFVEKEKKQTARQKNREVEVEEGEWFSDPGEEEDLDRVPLSEDENECAKHPIFKENNNLKNVELVVGLTFENAQQYREVLRDWCVRHGYDIEWLKNENRRITVKCKHDGCDWRVHASPIMGGPTFQIKTIKGQHTCARTYDNSLAKTSYLAKRMENAIRDNPNIPIQQLKNTILRKCNVEHNPGSKLILRKVDGSDPPVFEKLYFSLFAMKSAFLSGCRPLIGLDGCFLKTCFKGQLLVAVGRDGNDNMVPIALAIVPIENRETWTWFVLLTAYVPELQVEIQISRTKGIFLESCSTANKKDFEAFMKKIESLDPKVSDDVETASEWLKKVLFQHWARSFFPVYLPGVKDYIQTPYEPLKAPQLKKKRGRPKKLRRRGPDELQNTSTRRGLTHTCGNCLQIGHNKHSCKNPTHQKSKFYKGHGNPEEVATQGSQAPPHSQHDAMEEANMNQSQPSPAVQKQPSVSQQSIHFFSFFLLQ
ncbi:UNVERIFIED_CONTAM: hypothetical protein Sradi_1552400 [Sesamum radiatum]|uniref:Transposase MuDR plant domain-containing protein n=1 Tax=Sesamum radiatum TaxID=300843 RepID=A0AAW2UAR4_SESRA